MKPHNDHDTRQQQPSRQAPGQDRDPGEASSPGQPDQRPGRREFDDEEE